MSFNSSDYSSDIDINDDYQIDDIIQNDEPEQEPEEHVEPAPKPSKKQDKPKKTPKPKSEQQKNKTREIKQSFNPKLLTHGMNSFYDDYKFKDASTIKDGKEQGKIIIDISKYTALDEFKRAVESHEESENRKSTKTKETEKWNAITHGIWNFKLRGILTAINDNFMKKKLEDGTIDTSLFTDHLISQLNLSSNEEFSPSGIVGNIAEFFTSSRFKFKLYNSMFSHPSLSPEKSEKDKGIHLNKLYLQNISKFHDEYLRMIYTGKVSSSTDLFKYACQKISKDITTSKDMTADRLFNADYKKLNESFTKDERIEFEKVIKSVKYEKVVSERYFKCYSLSLEQNLTDEKDAKKQYKAYVETIKHFQDVAKTIMASDVSTHEKFIDVFVSAYREADKLIHYKNSIKNFIKDIECQKKLMFTQRFKQILSRIISDDQSLVVKYSGQTFSAEFEKKDGKKAKVSGDIIQEEKHTFNSIYSILGKIGLIGGNKVRKDIRVGLGIGVIDYIIGETKIACSRMKKSKNDKHQRKIIYIKA